MRKKERLEFKEKLESLKSEILQNLNISSANLRAFNAQNQSEEIEFSSVANLAKIDENLLNANKKRLKEINAALEKIEGRKFGICEMCDEKIDIERLRAKPFARFCISCREIYEKQQKGR